MVVIPTFSVIIAEGHLTADLGHFDVPYEAYVADITRGACRLQRLRDGVWLEAALPPQPCLALVGWHERDMTALEQVHNALVASNPVLTPDIVMFDPPATWSSVMAAAGLGLEAFARSQAQLVTALSKDLAVLRRAQDEMQHNFRALESFVHDRRVQMIEEAFVNQPVSGSSIDLFDHAEGGFCFAQLLPVSTKNLSAVAFHVAHKRGKADAPVKIALHVPELGKSLEEWTLPCGAIRQGWNTLGLPATLGGIAKSAVLTFHATAVSQNALDISLGSINPLAAFQVIGSSGAALVDRSLALRCFVSPPGVTVPHDGLTVMPDSMAGDAKPWLIQGHEQFPVSAHSLQQANELTEQGLSSDVTLVSFDSERGELMVHPAQDGPTCAFIPACLPAGTRRVIADIAVDHANAKPVSFRIAAVPGMTPPDMLSVLGAAQIEPSGAFVSEWETIAHGKRVSVEVALPDAMSGSGSIVLVTRMHKRAANDFAWAKFAHLRYELGE